MEHWNWEELSGKAWYLPICFLLDSSVGNFLLQMLHSKFLQDGQFYDPEKT